MNVITNSSNPYKRNSWAPALFLYTGGRHYAPVYRMTMTVATMGYASSFNAELEVRKQARAMGLKEAGLPAEGKLVALARALSPMFYKDIAGIRRGGQDINQLRSWEIIDRLYHVDLIVKYEGRYIGIDVTLLPDSSFKRYQKGKRLEKLNKLHKALGVAKTLVFNPKEGLSLEAFLRIYA